MIRCRTAVITLTILLTVALPTIIHINGGGADIDPAPLARVLQDVVQLVLSKRYVEALNMCNTILNLSLPPDIGYVHGNMYRNFIKLIEILNITEDVSTYGLQDRNTLRNAIYQLYSFRIEFFTAYQDYRARLSKYFQDPATSYLILRSLDTSIENLGIFLESRYNKLLNLYLGSRGREIEIEMRHPSQVYGDESLPLFISMKSGELVDYVNLSLTVIYGDVYTKTYSYLASPNIEFQLAIEVPRADDLYRLGIDVAPQLRARIIAIATASSGNATLYGYALSNFTVVYERPRISVSMPGSIHPNTTTITVNISLQTFYSLNISIYLDAISNETLLTSLDLAPGLHVIELYVPNLSLGYHRIIVCSEPRGRYLGYTFSYTFAVVGERIVAVANINPFTVIPMAKLFVEIYVETSEPYTMDVYIDGKLYARYSDLDKQRVYIDINPPFAFLIGKHSILIEVKPKTPVYMPSTVSSSFYVFNMVSFIAITILLAVVLTTPSRAEYVIEVFRMCVRTLTAASRRSAEITTIAVGAIRRAFRESRLVSLYRKLLPIVSVFAEPPREHETLREFYHRIEKILLNPVKILIKRFLDLYEQDLYSNRVVNVIEAEIIVKEIERFKNR